MTTLHVYSNRHISAECLRIKKGDWIYLENELSQKRWSLFFRYHGINEEELTVTYITQAEFFVLSGSNNSMKFPFDAVVGNPPYNDSNNGNIPIYGDFVKKALQLGETVSMVIPSSLAMSDERGGDEIRPLVFNSKTKLIKFLPTGTFENADVETLYFSVGKDPVSATTVTNKDRKSYKTSNYGGYIWQDETLLKILTKCNSAGATESWIKFTRIEKPKTSSAPIKTLVLVSPSKTVFADTNIVDRFVNEYRVVTSLLPNSRHHLDVLAIIPPGIAVKEGYTVTVCSNITEADNLVRYLKSKLVLFLYAKTKTSRTLRTPQLKFIPKVDLTRTWTDAELYAHFGLTEEEIAYVEANVK